MFNSSILDVIIGLVFCFASVALIASSVNEAIASMLKLRHKTLLDGIQKMLNDPSGDGLVKSLYEHALINPLSLVMPPTAAVTPAVNPTSSAQNPPVQSVVKPKVPAWAKLQQLPAYIDSKDFAHALLDIIRTAPQANADLKADLNSISDPQLRQALQGFYARAQGDVDKFADAVANWFDNAMNRLSGAYKRQAQFWTFFIGLAVAVGLNVDSIHVLDVLWKRPELAAAIVSPSSKELINAAAREAAAQAGSGTDATAPAPDAAQATDTSTAVASVLAAVASSASAPSATNNVAGRDGGAQKNADTLNADYLVSTLSTLPVGWSAVLDRPKALAGKAQPQETPALVYSWVLRVLGWLITASAAVFGAPFWFDLLQQLIQVRGTGAKPATNIDKKKPQVTSPATP